MHSAQRILLAVSCLLCFAFFKYLWDEETANEASTGGHVSPARSSKQKALVDSHSRARCADLDGLQDLAIILKTGSTEIYAKLPIHFQTTFRCTDDYVIYSDVAQDFAGIPIRDAMALVSDTARAESKDLAQYKVLNDHVALGGSAAELKGDESWHLDKWKFLPMISDAYEVYGDSKKRYFFIEADTYVSLHNLLPWLSKLDHRRAIYAGAQVMIGKTEFGHGGSGFLLSNTAAKALSEVYKSNQSHWEQVISDDCCGDKVMAEVLQAADPPVHLLRAFPLIQGETLSSLDWSPTHWCKPAVTWHHVDAAEIDKLTQFDLHWREEKGPDTPILFKDYYAAFINPRLLAAKDSMLPDWDNLSNDWRFSAEAEETYDVAVESAWACRSFCEDTQGCVQWAWRPGSCKGGKKVRLGWALRNRPELGSAEDRIEKTAGKRLEGAVSGWVMERIEGYKEEVGRCEVRKFWVIENQD